jgi:hypothetical protein
MSNVKKIFVNVPLDFVFIISQPLKAIFIARSDFASFLFVLRQFWDQSGLHHYVFK